MLTAPDLSAVNATPAPAEYDSVEMLLAKLHGVLALGLTEIVESTDSRELSLLDAGAYIRLTSADSCEITLPPQEDVAWVAGTTIYFRIAGAGIPTLVEGDGVTVNGIEVLEDLEQHATFAIRRTATEDVWDLI